MVTDPREDDGMSIDDYNYDKTIVAKKSRGTYGKIEKKAIKVVESKKVTIEQDLDPEEFKRLVDSRFPAWSKGSTKIANFMHNLDPTKVYTKEEIQEACAVGGIRLLDCHIIAGQKRVKYGNILQVRNGTYQLFPSLVGPFCKHFDV